MPANKIVKVDGVSTRHPEHYHLINTNDGSVWRPTEDGTWVRGTYPGPFALAESRIMDEFGYRTDAFGLVALFHWDDEVSGCHDVLIKDVNGATAREVLDAILHHLVLHHM